MSRVLVIEDDEDTAVAVTEILALEHEVQYARDGEEALACAVGFVPEVAFVDLTLRGTSGFDVARRLRNLFGKSVHLIAFTGHDMDDSTVRAAGFDDLVRKPASADRLLAAAAGELR